MTSEAGRYSFDCQAQLEWALHIDVSKSGPPEYAPNWLLAKLAGPNLIGDVVNGIVGGLVKPPPPPKLAPSPSMPAAACACHAEQPLQVSGRPCS